MSKSVWGVYTQFEPTYKYEEHLESIWDSEEKALQEAKSDDMIMYNDWVTVQEIQLNEKYQNYEKLKSIVVKRPGRIS